MPKLKTTRRSLIKNLDVLHSQVVRLRAIDYRGYGTCFTCRKSVPASALTCGHWWSRDHKAIRWEFWNTRAQCLTCQGARNGERKLFEDRLREEFGDDQVERMKLRRFETRHWTVDELLAMIEERLAETLRVER